MNAFLRFAGVFLSGMVLVSCTVMRPLNYAPEQLQQELRQGQKVQITTTDGRQLRFTVDHVDNAGISDGSQVIPFGDIQSIRRQQIDATRTTLLILGVIAGGAAAASGGGGGGGGGGGY